MYARYTPSSRLALTARPSPKTRNELPRRGTRVSPVTAELPHRRRARADSRARDRSPRSRPRARGGLWPALLLGALLPTPGCDDFESEPGENANCEPLALGCAECHGDPERGDPAPPVDTQGRNDTSEVTVGAHQAHLGTSDWHAELRCEDCHQVPAAVNAAGHIDGGPAELTWGALATTGDASPRFDRTATTCDGVYCHGTTLLGPNTGGAVSRTPLWTTVDGTYAQCGTTCHTLPPGGGHPANDQCQICHGDVISGFNASDPAASTWNQPLLHINGTVD
jgi:predicted CxxxxCH...CXXCH cytochrome family protein